MRESVKFVRNGEYNVDEESIIKSEFKWSMDILHHKTGPSNFSNSPTIGKALATFESLDKHVLHVKIIDSTKKRWKVPIFNTKPPYSYNRVPLSTMGLEVNNKPFAFKIVDPVTNETLIELSKEKQGTLQFTDKYLEISFRFGSQNVFGFGERVLLDFDLCHGKDTCTYTIWGKDCHTPIDKGTGYSSQTYGHQPFYMLQLPSTKQFLGVLILNSNAQDMVMDKLKNGELMVTHKMIGGIFDIYIFYPGTAESMLSKYHQLIGLPNVPPFWSLGYHQSRFGWKSLKEVKAVVRKFEENDIPLEVIWADIDYMEDKADFTIDHFRYSGLGRFVKRLHKKKIYWVPILDAGLKYDINDKYYKLGEEHNAFIKSAVTQKTLIAKVWPGDAVFLSWFTPKAKEIWHIGMQDLYNEAEFDGIWLDMNEVASFCPGECSRDIIIDPKLKTLPNHDPHEFSDLPYIPGQESLIKMTISLTAYHPTDDPDDDRLLKEYNTHGLWNLYQSKVTHEFFTEKLKKRSFILTRSNFVGTGLYAAKWLGDNHSTWEHLRASIIGIFNYQLFGIPLVGDDLCGFLGNSDEELCLRWMQLGAFYPFTRNHNDMDKTSHEPYAVGEHVLLASRNAIRQKYSILRYYYTKLFEVSLYGGTLIRPLFFEFPFSASAYTNMNNVFMVGHAILVIPVLYKDAKEFSITLPSESWYELRTLKKLLGYTGKEEKFKLLPDKEYVNVLLRGGSIISYQDALKEKIRRTEELKTIPMEIIVAPDHKGEAVGSLIVDDGLSLDPIGNKAYRHLEFNFSKANKQLTVNLKNMWDKEMYEFERFSKLTVLDVEEWKDMITLCIKTRNGNEIKVDGGFEYDNKKMTYYTPKSSIYWSDIATITFNSGC